METVLLTLGLMALAMGVMAVGVIFGRKPLKGSCGGTGGSCACADARMAGACKRKGGPGHHDHDHDHGHDHGAEQGRFAVAQDLISLDEPRRR